MSEFRKTVKVSITRAAKMAYLWRTTDLVKVSRNISAPEIRHPHRFHKRLVLPYGSKGRLLELGKVLVSQTPQPKTWDAKAARLKHYRPLEVSTTLGDEVMAMARREHPRKRRWQFTQAVVSPVGYVVVEREDRNVPQSYLSLSYRYPTDYIPRISSFARVADDGGTLVAYLWSIKRQRLERHERRAPRGYVLTADADGIMLTRGGAERHIDTDFLTPGGPRRAAARVRNQINRVKVARKAQREFAAALKGVKVTMGHARKAGLCRAGIIGWCRSHGVEPSRGLDGANVTPAMLQDSRFLRAARMAIQNGEGSP